jgi:hypothetical protein
MFAVFKNPRIRFANRIEDRGRLLVPVPRSEAGLADVKLPRGVLNYGSVTRLFYGIVSLINYVVDVDPVYATVVASFVLYDWISDRMPMAVYLSIIGLPQSGKSTLLELLSMICRQPLLVSDISQAAIYEACSHFSPTLLIDEVDWQSPEAKRLLLTCPPFLVQS